MDQNKKSAHQSNAAKARWASMSTRKRAAAIKKMVAARTRKV